MSTASFCFKSKQQPLFGSSITKRVPNELEVIVSPSEIVQKFESLTSPGEIEAQAAWKIPKDIVEPAVQYLSCLPGKNPVLRTPGLSPFLAFR